MSGQLTMYTTPWCGFCRNLKHQLARAGIEVSEVDIERNPAAAQYVMSVNGGNQTVPTVLFPDGSTLVNPSAAQVRDRLAVVGQGLEGADPERGPRLVRLKRSFDFRTDRGSSARDRTHA